MFLYCPRCCKFGVPDPCLTCMEKPVQMIPAADCIPKERVRELKQSLIAAFDIHPQAEAEELIDTAFDGLLTE